MAETSRRELLAGALALGSASDASSSEIGARSGRIHRLPSDFLWGTAISGHQSEGNNTNSDSWVRENVQPTLYADRSGDACDSYHRYAEDIQIAARLGFNCYRLGIEWSRIEPSEGRFSNAELDHYADMLETCRSHGLKPVVTFNHFTVPIWFAARGGFEAPDSPELFARYCGQTAQHLGPLMHLATTFNEANVALLVGLLYPSAPAAARAMNAAAGQAVGSSHFSSLAFADPAISSPLMQEAHRRGYGAIKAARPDLPVGLTLTTQDVQAAGPDSRADEIRAALYGGWIEVARSHADFIGVQPYTRFLVDANGIVPAPAGAERTDAGYEFYPQAVAGVVRWAHANFDKPIYVTENGIATDDDTRRVAFIDQALDAVRDCVLEGIPVRSYLHWSLLDNFEWTSGFGKHFGLVGVDLQSFKRTLKPSALHLGAIARANRL
jgi:beta-glucosidase